ncbi:uncharacterized protein NPIL_134821 [Nephila pilipes]|uniref:Uncharacterized protein n=1 Tax=Nephila pilipes TaxID=299642 RepID=A0A8X6TRQ3_NEPPI|nr:uncharacterized protein NPIL_134821 [Nephila pilipes]
MKNIFIDPPLVITLSNNNRQINIELKQGFDWIVTPEKGSQLLRMLGLDPHKTLTTSHRSGGFTLFRRYQAPDREIFKNQTFQLIEKEPILDETSEIKLKKGDLLEQIKLQLNDLVLGNEVHFTESNGQVIVTLRFNIKIEFKKNICPRLMSALNIIDDAYTIFEKSRVQFPYTRPTESIKDESFHVIVYKTYPTKRKETKTKTLLIPSEMYQTAQD